jgi:ketosteroid isomerase-like protein
LPTPVFQTPEAAEAAFYRAFTASDLAAMMAVWAPDDDIACIHPMSAPLGGREPIRQSWAGIFRNSSGMALRVDTARMVHEAGLAIHLVYEHIRPSDKSEFQPPVVATNVYRHSALGWHMILHHASPTPPPRAPARPTVLH